MMHIKHPGQTLREGSHPSEANRRLLRAAVLAAALVGSSLTAAPASAQWFGRQPPLAPWVIARTLGSQGYAEVGRPRFTGSAYVVEAVTPRGLRVRLLVDPYDGAVVQRTRLEDLRPPRDVGPGRWVEPDEGRRFVPRPLDRRRFEDDDDALTFEPEVAPSQPRRREQARTEPATPPTARKAPVEPRPKRDASEARVVPPAQPEAIPAAPPASAPDTKAVSKPSQKPPRSTTAAAAEAKPTRGPVRVIGGITPLDPDQPGTAAEPRVDLPPEASVSVD